MAGYHVVSAMLLLFGVLILKWFMVLSTIFSHCGTKVKILCKETPYRHDKNFSLGFEPRIEPKIFCDNFLTLKTPRKPVSENFVCLCRLLNILANFSNLFCILAKSVDPDQIAPLGAVWSGSTLFGAIWSGSTLFAKMTFKITSRWHSRRQLLLGLAV